MKNHYEEQDIPIPVKPGTVRLFAILIIVGAIITCSLIYEAGNFVHKYFILEILKHLTK